MAAPKMPEMIYYIGACGLAAAAIFIAAQGAFVTQSSFSTVTTKLTTSPAAVTSQSRPIEEAVTMQATDDSSTTKIVPADSRKGDSSWSPLTGDGSN